MGNDKSKTAKWKALYVGCGDWDLMGPDCQQDWELAASAPQLQAEVERLRAISTQLAQRNIELTGMLSVQQPAKLGSMPAENYIDMLLIRCQELEGALRAFVAHAESRQRPDQHNPYTARELWPDLFAASDRALRISAATASASQPTQGAG